MIPSAPNQTVGAAQLKRPVFDLAALAFTIDIEPDVRIHPFDLGDHTGQLDRAISVEY